MVWRKHFEENTGLEGGCVVAIGNFDGVHAGHRAVLAAARAEAQRLGVPTVALTFEPHPRAVLFPETRLVRLTEVEEKVRLLGEAGADGVAVVDFDRSVAGWSPDDFVNRVLVGWLGAKVVCVGEDFKYGARAKGDVASLGADGRFGLVVVAPVRGADGAVVSSRGLRAERETA